MENLPGTQVRRTNIRRFPDGRLVFCGIQGINSNSGDIVRQMAIIINLWNIENMFPIEFQPLNMGAQVVDETVSFIESISVSAT